MESGDGDQIVGVPTHGGRYVQYNVRGSLFEVSANYVPPLRFKGTGSYGAVCAATNSKTGERVAIKKIVGAFDDNFIARRTLSEIKIVRHLNHENIIAIKDIICPPSREAFNDVYIVYELMDTDLDRVIKNNQPLSDEHCQFFLYQILAGLKCIHAAKVLHRDLKPSNLFVNADCKLKIGDFGLARILVSETDTLTAYVVTRYYRAPELLLGCSDYTAAIDIWSVGCILGEIVNGEPLFLGKDHFHQLKLIIELIGSPDDPSIGFIQKDATRRIMRQLPQCSKQDFSAIFPKMSPGAVDLMERMLVFDPSKRITVDEALNHPYLAAYRVADGQPVSTEPFDFDVAQSTPTIKDLVWTEALSFHPDPLV